MLGSTPTVMLLRAIMLFTYFFGVPDHVFANILQEALELVVGDLSSGQVVNDESVADRVFFDDRNVEHFCTSSTVTIAVGKRCLGYEFVVLCLFLLISVLVASLRAVHWISW